MRLILMRHGATPGNEEHRYVGRGSDEPLSDTGRRQCAQAGRLTDVDRVFASPLLRTRQTAHICFPSADVETVGGLEEFDFGAFEGHTAAEMADDEAYRRWVEGNCEGPCPEGESRADYIARSNAALVELLRNAHDNGQDQVIVVAHGGTIMAAFSVFAHADEQQDYFAWRVGNAQGYAAHVDLGGPAPVFSNCTKFEKLPINN